MAELSGKQEKNLALLDELSDHLTNEVQLRYSLFVQQFVFKLNKNVF